MSYMTITPHRGGKTKMTTGSSSNIVLAAGELFIEYPDDGVGSGKSKIKIGDGVTAYSSLPYAVGDTSTDRIDFTNGSQQSIQAALNDVASGNSLDTIIGSLKRAVSLCKEKLDLVDSTIFSPHDAFASRNGIYRAGMSHGILKTPEDMAAFISEHGINGYTSTYDDLFVGDGISIDTGSYNGVMPFRIAGFNTFYRCGDTGAPGCGITLVMTGSGKSGSKYYNTAEDMTGGFINSNVFKNDIPALIEGLSETIGVDHIASMRLNLTTGYNGDKATVSNWYSTKACLMSSQSIGMPCPDSSIFDFGVDTKLPIFNFMHPMQTCSGFMLRDCQPGYNVLSISNGGRIYKMGATSGGYGFRYMIYIV